MCELLKADVFIPTYTCVCISHWLLVVVCLYLTLALGRRVSVSHTGS